MDERNKQIKRDGINGLLKWRENASDCHFIMSEWMKRMNLNEWVNKYIDNWK